MMSAEEIWSLLREKVSPREIEDVDLAGAWGRTLREAVRTTEDMPPFDRSAVDGFLVASADTSEVFTVVGEIRAGEADLPVLPMGNARRIGTGAPVPEGGEVIMLEDAKAQGDQVSFSRRGADHIRRRGEDARAGDEVVPAGVVLCDGQIALLASVGCVRPRVTRRPVAQHIATGNEIVEPSAIPGPGQIRDANSALVLAWAQWRGLKCAQARIREDAAALRERLSENADLLLVSGGASVGRHDYTEAVLREAGFEILVTKVNARPGKPLIIGRRGEQWAFGLPGNPLSHFVCLHVFVDAAVSAMNGAASSPVLLSANVTDWIAGNPRETWWPAKTRHDGLCPLRWASSGDLTALASADALVRVPVSGLAAGARAEFIRTR